MGWARKVTSHLSEKLKQADFIYQGFRPFFLLAVSVPQCVDDATAPLFPARSCQRLWGVPKGCHASAAHHPRSAAPCSGAQR